MAHWSADLVPYRVNPTGSADVNDGSDVIAAHVAFTEWSLVSCSRLDFQFVGDVGVADFDQAWGNQGNDVYWVETAAWPYSSSVLGVTHMYFDGAGVIQEADIAFNGFLHEWSTTGESGTIDVRDVALHEVGHAVGLGHLETWTVEAPPVMSYGAGYAQLTDDDRWGACFLYPAGDYYACELESHCPHLFEIELVGNKLVESYPDKLHCANSTCIAGLAPAGAGVGPGGQDPPPPTVGWLGATCSSDNECAPPHICRDVSPEGGAVCTRWCLPGGCPGGWSCAATAGIGGRCAPKPQETGLELGAACAASAECKSGLCAAGPAGVARCRRPCVKGQAFACEAGESCQDVDGGAASACISVSELPTPTHEPPPAAEPAPAPAEPAPPLSSIDAGPATPRAEPAPGLSTQAPTAHEGGCQVAHHGAPAGSPLLWLLLALTLLWVLSLRLRLRPGWSGRPQRTSRPA